ncbi:MAG: hypothetical protein HZC17_03560, partial [Candidatus Omnitrophica bacterium]|nr:hypothetical protein [Candidatus Omnitrophota bacterium]
TFTHNSGTVIFDGANQIISGSTTFNNFTKTVTAADTLTFAASSTQTIAGTMTLQGAAGQLLSLRSSIPGTQWNIDPQGTRTIAYLDVQYSNNANVALINALGTGSVSSGNNTNWLFDNEVSGHVYSDEGVTVLPSVNVSVSINGGAPSLSFGTDASGAYTASGFTLVSGDVVTVYLNTNAGAEKGVTVTISNATGLSGIDIYQNHLIVRHEAAGSITNTHLDTANNSGDTDISAIYTMSGLNLTILSGKELFVWAGSTYIPGGTVSGGDVDVRGTMSMQGNNLTITNFAMSAGSTFTAPTGNMQISGNVAIGGGTFNHNSGTVTLVDPTAASINFGGVTLNHLTFSTGSTTTKTFTGDVTIAGDLIVAGVDFSVKHPAPRF